MADRTKTRTPYFRPSKKLTLTSAREIAKAKHRPRRRLWGRLIRGGMLGMIHGRRGSGKTFFTLGVAISMASGKPFLGHQPKRPAKVVLLDGEMGSIMLKERLKRIAAALGTKVPKQLLILAPDTYDGILPSLAVPTDQKLIDEIIPADTEVIIVDNFSSWNRGGREDADGWDVWNSWLLRHKRRGRTVIVVHHSGKRGDQRGSSRREDQLDFVIALTEARDGEHPKALSFDLTWTKLRHLDRSQAPALQAAWAENQWKHRVAIAEPDRAARAIELFRSGMKKADIARQLRVDRATVTRWTKGISAPDKGESP